MKIVMKTHKNNFKACYDVFLTEVEKWTSNDESFDIDELSEEDLKEIANDYFFECGGIYNADYCDFEFDI